MMQKTWTPPVRLVFGAATLLGIFSTLQAYRLTALNINEKMDIVVWRLLVLNLALWYVPAALTGSIFRIAQHFRVDTTGWPRALGVHALAAITFSIIHLAAMMGVRAVLWPGMFTGYGSWTSFVQRSYLMSLDWALMTYAAIVGLSYALGYYRESQARAIGAAHLEARLAEARLKTLEAELHPHFLFNTLHAISTLVHTQPDAADRMISRLSDLLRITFSRSGSACVPLQEELEFLQKYLEIEQTRFQDRLTVEYEIDPDTLDAEVPRLILQPIVENAIKHGVAPRTAPGRITIGSRLENNQVSLVVRDNGPGLSDSARAGAHEGVGLSNTRDRLECLYGTAQGLNLIESGHGLSVEMRLPYRCALATADETATRVA
jgi:two-component system, LytTR family, sensor kinase